MVGRESASGSSAGGEDACMCALCVAGSAPRVCLCFERYCYSYECEGGLYTYLGEFRGISWL